jgi:2-polyprenyl-3-methyl-5-hydroxy-6-metoxy-1,4-benzoquinol methylase
MVPTTERTNFEEVERFYDGLAPRYDAMTGFERRFAQEKPFFRLLVDNNRVKTAIDAGSGTGFHSLLLAQMGVNVTAVDVSEEMLNLLRAHARDMGVRIGILHSTFQSLASRGLEGTDAVFCMGNSLSHLLSAADLRESMRNFARVLRPGGIFFAQILNYERILSKRERVQSVKEESGSMYIRFYDYGGEFLLFNILTIRRSPSGLVPELQSVRLRPLCRRDLLEAMEGTGFGELRTFGSIAMEEYRPEESRDLVLLARLGP